MSDSVTVSLITSASAVLVAAIGAWATSSRAVNNAVKPLQAAIQRLRERVIELGGDPDDE